MTPAPLMRRWHKALDADAVTGLAQVRTQLLEGAAAGSTGRTLYVVLTTLLDAQKATWVAQLMQADLKRSQEELAGALADTAAGGGADRQAGGPERQEARTRQEALLRRRGEAEAGLRALERSIEEVTQRLARAQDGRT